MPVDPLPHIWALMTLSATTPSAQPSELLFMTFYTQRPISKITAQYFDEKKLFFSGKVSIVLLFWISGKRRLCSIESQVRVLQMRDIIDKEEVHSFNVLKIS
jgi:hypothetical protein